MIAPKLWSQGESKLENLYKNKGSLLLHRGLSPLLVLGGLRGSGYNTGHGPEHSIPAHFLSTVPGLSFCSWILCAGKLLASLPVCISCFHPIDLSVFWLLPFVDTHSNFAYASQPCCDSCLVHGCLPLLWRPGVSTAVSSSWLLTLCLSIFVPTFLDPPLQCLLHVTGSGLSKTGKSCINAIKCLSF